MTRLDFSPLYRSSIGFDRMASMLDSMHRSDQNQPSYPPYNIEVNGEDSYRISMAISGFKQNELNIESGQNTLTITGKKDKNLEEKQFLHRGIAERNFERRFQLADYVRVTSATMDNGLLHIDLVREIPDAMKTRTINIGQADTQGAAANGSPIEPRVVA